LGPAPAPLALLRGKYRIRFLIKSQKDINLQDEMRKWLRRTSIPQKVRIQVDIDPYSFM
jgi:primosomal protein N' (replication factor Y)